MLPGAAAGPQVMAAVMRLSPLPRTATYFVRLHVRAERGRPRDENVLVQAQQVWSSALIGRYGQPAPKSPQILRVRPEQFEIGFNSAVRYVSSHPTH